MHASRAALEHGAGGGRSAAPRADLGLRAVGPDERAEGEQPGPHHRAAHALAPLPRQPAAAAAQPEAARGGAGGRGVEGEPVVPADDGEEV